MVFGLGTNAKKITGKDEWGISESRSRAKQRFRFRCYEGSFYLVRQISNPVVYSSSKAAVVGLTRYLAANWGDVQIRVNALVRVAWRAVKMTPSRRVIPPASRWLARPSRMKWSEPWFIWHQTPRVTSPASAWWSMAA